METINTTISLSQYLIYLSYMFLGIILTILFACIYLFATPVKELRLIKTGNSACAISFGGAVCGFAITIGSSLMHSIGLIDFAIWAAIATLMQLLVYFSISKIVSDASKELAANNIAVGILLAFFSVSIGIINATCLT
ncbi:MAG: DUF350 domain-containing protein [Cardiobacteriaceae bacterium]|nr:DUF350 domain-containing protein [Cardiobacteriaceae bacterium]